MTRRRMRVSIATRLGITAAAIAVVAIAAGFTLHALLPQSPVVASALAAACVVPFAVLAVRAQLQPMLAMTRALGGTVFSYRDGDFSFGLHWDRDDEIGELVQAHNALGDVLREQRLALVQRELLLDTMVQNTPVAMLLVQGQQVVFANVAARQLLGDGRRLEGSALGTLLDRADRSLREAVERGGDGLFTAAGRGTDAEDEIYHLARRQFALNGQRHELLLLRHLTTELRRQEVQTWKTVIRVISHELNNSLAPVASLARSANELLRRGQTERLPGILDTVEDRARHLERFIQGYARFAKLPTPHSEPVDWQDFLAALRLQAAFTLGGDVPGEPAHFDRSQLEQAMLNLLRNAHESGSPPESVTVCVRRGADRHVIEVADRGSGMTETVMANALVPFYSTKRTGTGLGLALAREIAEAHGGRIALANRDGGGLVVQLVLPSGRQAGGGPGGAT